MPSTNIGIYLLLALFLVFLAVTSTVILPTHRKVQTPWSLIGSVYITPTNFPSSPFASPAPVITEGQE